MAKRNGKQLNLPLDRFGLRLTEAAELTIRRRRNGSGFVYLLPSGRRLRDRGTLARLRRLAVPPAYEDVVFAADPRAHLQAVGRDSAGRAQYRYHPDWEKVRELRKARRLARLARLLPKIRSWVGRHLRDSEPTRDFALAALIELVACTALRAGSETYLQQHGTRGATTLLKSNVSIRGEHVALNFRGKGGHTVEKQIRSRRLARALRQLSKLPGRRLFQYRAADGRICRLRRRDANAALRAIAGKTVALKDFRTIIASSQALEQLAEMPPKPSARGRRRQVLAAVRGVAAQLANTAAVCRRSYVHDAVVAAFDTGLLHRMRRASGSRRSVAERERMLVRVLSEMENETS